MPLIIYFSLIQLIAVCRIYMTLSWREACLYALIIWGVFIFLFTEFLSCLQLIDYGPVLIGWLVVNCALFVLLWSNREQVNKLVPLNILPDSCVDRILLGIISLIIVVTAILAFGCPPNTYDALSYHMARVAHWVQNHSIDFYPTHVLRQLVSPPWQEYAILNFQLLARGDYFANSIQWLAMVSSIIGMSLIAQYLGLSSRAQWMTALIVATIPMGILQSSSTQGDYTVSLWLIGAMAIWLKDKWDWKMIILFSLSLSLAFLTKGTGILFGLVLIGWFLIKIRFSLIRFAVMGLIILTMMGGYFFRNYQAHQDSMLLSAQVHGVNVDFKDISLKTTVANGLRNTGMQLATGIKWVDVSLEKGIYKIGEALAIDINDSRATFGDQAFHIESPSRNEDTATGGLHFLMYIICVGGLIWLRSSRTVAYYVLCILAMGLMLNIFVRWQPWGSRFHLPLLILAAPLVGLLCDRIKITWLQLSLVLISFAVALPYLINGSPRHLVGKKSFLKQDRLSNLFATRLDWKPFYTQLAASVEVSGCKQIGLVMGGDGADYLFYEVLNSKKDPSIRIEHVKVDNFSNEYAYPLGPFTPCKIIPLPN